MSTICYAWHQSLYSPEPFAQVEEAVCLDAPAVLNNINRENAAKDTVTLADTNHAMFPTQSDGSYGAKSKRNALKVILVCT
jgi:hypothetical protein